MRHIILFAVIVATLGVAVQFSRSTALGQTQQPRADASVPNGIEPAKRAKLEAARSAYELTVAMAEHGGTRVPDTDDRYTWSRRWMEAERECATDDAARRAAAAAHLECMKRLLDVSRKRLDAGMISASEAAATRYYAAEAEQWVAEAGRPQ